MRAKCEMGGIFFIFCKIITKLLKEAEQFKKKIIEAGKITESREQNDSNSFNFIPFLYLCLVSSFILKNLVLMIVLSEISLGR